MFENNSLPQVTSEDVKVFMDEIGKEIKNGDIEGNQFCELVADCCNEYFADYSQEALENPFAVPTKNEMLIKVVSEQTGYKSEEIAKAFDENEKKLAQIRKTNKYNQER